VPSCTGSSVGAEGAAHRPGHPACHRLAEPVSALAADDLDGDSFVEAVTARDIDSGLDLGDCEIVVSRVIAEEHTRELLAAVVKHHNREHGGQHHLAVAEDRPSGLELRIQAVHAPQCHCRTGGRVQLSSYAVKSISTVAEVTGRDG
jgi:hypothetical protein